MHWAHRLCKPGLTLASLSFVRRALCGASGRPAQGPQGSAAGQLHVARPLFPGPFPLSPPSVSSQMSAVGFYIRRLMHFQSGWIGLPCFDSLALVEIQLNFSKTRALKLNLHTVYTCFFLKSLVFTCCSTINSSFTFCTQNKHWFSAICFHSSA